MDGVTILAVADVGLPGTASTGGALRSVRSIKEYSKHFNVHLVLPPTCKADPDLLGYAKRDLRVSSVTRLDVLMEAILGRKRLSFVYPTIPSGVLKFLVRGLDRQRISPGAIVVLNETYECLSIGRVAKELFGSPSLAVLQLPLLYSDKRRRDHIRRAYELWYNELYRGERLGKLARELRTKLELLVAWSRFAREVIGNYDVLVAVSKAIAIEMGEEWASKLYTLDPGVSLDTEDLELISHVRCHVKERGDYLVLGGRIDALKGFVEALYAFKEIAKANTQLKLVATGYVSNKLKPRVERFVKRLGLEGKVVLAGVLSRVDRFRVVAGAKLTLYPSHIDAFPYSVLESLYLGTPVVAYNIPALEAYYGKVRGVTLVDEGDVHALATEALNVLGTKEVEISPPQLRSWDSIMEEEVSLINKLAGK